LALIPLAFIPQYRRITSRRSIDGVSPYELLFSVIAAASTVGVTILMPHTLGYVQAYAVKKITLGLFLLCIVVVFQSIQIVIGKAFM
jgi:uncharacterized protein with PQ loop repeat